MPKKILPMVLSVDIDPDHYDPSISRITADSSMSWRGLEQGVPQFKELLSTHTSFADIKVTWFIRVDDQIGNAYGYEGYLLTEKQSLWKELSTQGDELALHVHLYKEEAGSWIQDEDPTALDAQLRRSIKAMKSAGINPTSSRIGDSYHSNSIAASLDNIGISVDSSSLPGRIRKDSARLIDWSSTPRDPYHPSYEDYRSPGNPCRNILQIPMSMVKTQTSYDKEPLDRYVELSFRPEIIRDGLRDLITNATLLVTVLHPSGILNDLIQSEHQLIAFKPDAIIQNLEAIFDVASECNRVIQSVTMADAGKLFAANNRLGT